MGMQRNMLWEIDSNGILNMSVDLNESSKVSQSGKSRVLGTSGGAQTLQSDNSPIGPIALTLNVFQYPEDDDQAEEWKTEAKDREAAFQGRRKKTEDDSE